MPRYNWYQRKKDNDIDSHVINTKWGKMTVKQAFKEYHEDKKQQAKTNIDTDESK